MAPNGIHRSATTKDEASGKGKDMSAGVEDHTKIRGFEACRETRREENEMVLDALKRLEREVYERRKRRVSIPGAGLGRLAWEVSQPSPPPHRSLLRCKVLTRLVRILCAHLRLHASRSTVRSPGDELH